MLLDPESLPDDATSLLARISEPRFHPRVAPTESVVYINVVASRPRNEHAHRLLHALLGSSYCFGSGFDSSFDSILGFFDRLVNQIGDVAGPKTHLGVLALNEIFDPAECPANAFDVPAMVLGDISR